MSLKKKIILSFSVTALLIALLAVFEYANFVAIRNEIRFLELTDTIRSKSLQLRRHEKNFFLYGPLKAGEESKVVRRYLDELGGLLASPFPDDKSTERASLRNHVREYGRTFQAIEDLLVRLRRELHRSKSKHPDSIRFFPLIESAIYERPGLAADFLETVFFLPRRHPLVTGLNRLDAEIDRLRKTGEDIIATAKELDKNARDKAEFGIRISQAAIIIIFPLFLVIGIATLFFITRNIVNRLGLLIDVVEKTGRGQFGHVAVPTERLGNDEVDILIRKFDQMEDQLAERAAELERKNRELLQSKKLAAIGTLAAGVAHELNNPLNNIYLSAQVLDRQANDACPPSVKEVVGDILGQTQRVKRIVGDLLEFARGRDPKFSEVELNALISGAFKRLSMHTDRVMFSLDSNPDGVRISADPQQIELVFINLFTNAVEAMPGGGRLSVRIDESGDVVRLVVTDSGKGMPKDAIENIFEPFFTTKDKGTGLGLAIVFNIIKKHGGDIVVESQEGKGTAFTITLPRKRS